MSHCRACDATMQYTPMFVKLDDGTIIENTLCSGCSYIAQACKDDALMDDSADYDKNWVSDYIYVKMQ